MNISSLADELPAFDICTRDQSEFLNVLGGAALGSSITASVAGDSVLLIVTEGSVLIATAPAVAPALATTAIVGSSAYVFMKGYCNSDGITDVAGDLHQAAVEGAVETITVAAGSYESAVQQTSEKIEAAAEIHEIAVEQQSQNIERAAVVIEDVREGIADWICGLDPKCK